jgi:hypothetical protein
MLEIDEPRPAILSRAERMEQVRLLGGVKRAKFRRFVTPARS